ncbi:MAG: protoporphyrinogen oxidase HemJ [Hyphomicrobiales bacterium]
MLYLSIKAFHVMAIISWMAGIFYLPRLFVYHAERGDNPEISELFKKMERLLMRAIMTPAMVASWVAGLWIAYDMGFFGDTWFLLKLLLVIGMTAYHVYLEHCRIGFAEDRNRHGSKFYRMLNEVPTLLMIAIVILVIVKPF